MWAPLRRPRRVPGPELTRLGMCLHSAHARSWLCQEGFLTPCLSPLWLLLFPPGVFSFPRLCLAAVAAPGARRAPPSPALWLSIPPAAAQRPCPPGATRPHPQRGREGTGLRGKEGCWKGQPHGMNRWGAAPAQGMRSPTQRRVQKCRFSPMIARFQSGSTNNAISGTAFCQLIIS